jgi:hypothetical protein
MLMSGSVAVGMPMFVCRMVAMKNIRLMREFIGMNVLYIVNAICRVRKITKRWLGKIKDQYKSCRNHRQ